MTPKGDPRTQRFSFTMTPQEHAMLLAVAESEGRSAAGWIRHAARVAFEAKGLDLPKRRRKR